MLIRLAGLKHQQQRNPISTLLHIEGPYVLAVFVGPCESDPQLVNSDEVEEGGLLKR
jgi:hypothetical protein